MIVMRLVHLDRLILHGDAYIVVVAVSYTACLSSLPVIL